MIYTNEKIISPVEFITENVDASKSLEANGFEIVSGADFDVLIRSPEWMDEDDAPTTSNHELSPVLGNLAMAGWGSGIRVNGLNLNLHWFPSPTAFNQLSESLDRTPGIDVLRFVHSHHDFAPPGEYEKYLKRNQYPQSIGDNYFIHDRSKDHTLGILLSPTELLDCIKYWKNKKTTMSLVGTFDAGTASLSSVYEQMYTNGVDSPFFLGFASDLLERVAVMNGFLGSIRKHLKISEGTSRQPVYDLVVESYSQLLPKIEALKAANELRASN